MWKSSLESPTFVPQANAINVAATTETTRAILSFLSDHIISPPSSILNVNYGLIGSFEILSLF